MSTSAPATTKANRPRTAARRAALVTGLLTAVGTPVLLEAPAHAATCPISVASFGHDVSAAQSALKAVTASCHTVVFTPGTYTFNSTLVIRAGGVTVEADPGAVIKPASGARLGQGLVVIAASNVTLNGLTISGGGSKTDAVSVHAPGANVVSLHTTGILGRAVDVLKAGTNAVVTGCSVTGFGDRGITTESKGTTVRGCTVNGGNGIGISSFGGASAVSFLGNTVSGVGDKGIEVNSTSGFTISGNTSHDNATLGIHLLRSNNGTVSNNVVYSNLNNGIDAHGDTNLIIENNKSYRNGGPRYPDTLEGNGIIVYCSQHVQVLNNTVWDNGQHQPGKRDGIRISDTNGKGGEMATRYIVVSGNVAYDDQSSPTQGWGIRLGQTNHGDLNFITVRGNTGHGNMFSGIFEKGLAPNATATITNNNITGRH